MNKPDWAVSLQKIRQKNNLTQKQFAESIGLSERAIIQYENGLRMPTLLARFLLNQLFKVPLSNWNYNKRELKQLKILKEIMKGENK